MLRGKTGEPGVIPGDSGLEQLYAPHPHRAARGYPADRMNARLDKFRRGFPHRGVARDDVIKEEHEAAGEEVFVVNHGRTVG